MSIKECLIVLGLAATGLSVIPVRAHAAPPDELAAQCKALASTDFSRLPDAPTELTGTTTVVPSGDEPGYCQVTGYVAPQVGFVLRLPTAGWNGNVLELGCGGTCGSTDYISQCDDPLRRGYACIVSDSGHTRAFLWAYNNLQAELDYAIRGAHVTALAAKAIVQQHYGQAPKKSLFWGWSKGGQQAMMEAQRFPWDFDGILAGDPSMGGGDAAMAFIWAAHALTDGTGKPLLEETDLKTLHQAVVTKCDLNDGVKDGLIGDPRACDFDPARLLCTAEKHNGCLTAQQIEAVQKIYTGPIISQSMRIRTPIALKGSELTWHWLTDAASEEDWFRYIGFWPNPDPTTNFDFDRDYQRYGVSRTLHSTYNPDLREFKAAGGKLLSYTGWSTHVPLMFVDYYETAERTMGGRAATRGFFRLFEIPGMNHCAGGEGAFAVDWLSYLESWVEKGEAPEKVIGAHIKLDNPDDYSELFRRLKFPLDPSRIEFFRPAYPYPARVKYLGRGDPKDASNFGPVQ
jgi:Tannase and feruloyl esterase